MLLLEIHQLKKKSTGGTGGGNKNKHFNFSEILPLHSFLPFHLKIKRLHTSCYTEFPAVVNYIKTKIIHLCQKSFFTSAFDFSKERGGRERKHGENRSNMLSYKLCCPFPLCNN